jgi:tRNA threonylcarbamoyladenosine biosynthesis protein TsaE
MEDNLLLGGAMGAGKTALTQEIIRILAGESHDVTSPTFTLQHCYDMPELAAIERIIHMDLYRIDSPSELEPLGLGECYETALCIIEWPDRLGADAAPDHYIYAELQIINIQAREIRLHASETALARLQEMFDAMKPLLDCEDH